MRKQDLLKRVSQSFLKQVGKGSEAKTEENTLLFCFNVFLGRPPSASDEAFHIGRSTPTQLCDRILKSSEFTDRILPFATPGKNHLLPQAQHYSDEQLRSAVVASKEVFSGISDDQILDWATLIRALKASIENGSKARNVSAWEPLRAIKAEPAVDHEEAIVKLGGKGINSIEKAAAKTAASVKNKLASIDPKKATRDHGESVSRLSPEAKNDINLGFQLVLGRNAPEATLVASRLSGGFMSHLSRLIESWEFETRVLGLLMRNEATKHNNLSPVPEKTFRSKICEKMQLSEARTAAAMLAEDWEGFLLATVLHGDTFKPLLSKLGSAHQHILTDMRDAFETNRSNGFAIQNFVLSIGLDSVVYGKCQWADQAKPSEKFTVRAVSSTTGVLHDEAACVTDDDGWFDFALKINEHSAKKDQMVLIEIDFADGRKAARHVLRCVMANSLLNRELSNATRDWYKTSPASLNEKVGALVSASPFSEAPRLTAADIALSLAGDAQLALRYLPAFDAQSPEYQHARIRALGAAGDLNAAAAISAQNPKLYKGRQHIADFLRYTGEAEAQDQGARWMLDAAKVIQSHKNLRGNVSDYDALISTLTTDNFSHLVEVMVEFFVSPDFIVQAMLAAQEVEFKARQKWLLGLSGVSEAQALALMSAMPAVYVRNKDDLVRCAEHLLTVNRFFSAREFIEKAKYIFPDDKAVDKIRVAIFRRSRVPRDKKIAFEEIEQWYRGSPENPNALQAAEGLYAQIVQLDPLFFSPTGEKARRAKFDTLVAAAQTPATRIASLNEMAARLNATLRFQEAYDILKPLVEALPPGSRMWPLRHIMRCCEPLRLTDEGFRYAEMLLAENPGDYAAIQYIKACRQIGYPEKADALPPAIIENADLALRRELARNKFFMGDFEAAYSAVDALMDEHPRDVELQLLYGATLVELRDTERLEKLLSNVYVDHEQVLYLERELQRYALNYLKGDNDGAIAALNEMFATFGCQSLKLAAPDGTKGMYDRLTPSGVYEKAPHSTIGPDPIFDGPLVSIVMTAYEAVDYIETSVRSLLQQSYRNIEIIIVVDKSPDNTIDVVRKLAASDSRIRYINKATNDGTYVAKNMGIMQARGKYIALQDSDDWSHPDRIAKSIAVLEKNAHVVALTTDWLRITTEGELVVKAGGQISHVCCISIVFRRQEVLDAIGFYDSVRIEADMEYIRRLTVTFGASAVARLRWPLLFGRAHSASLTASQEYGITRVGFTEPRQLYQASQIRWHKDIAYGEAEGVTPFPMPERLFDAPDLMLPDKGKSKAKRAKPSGSKPATKAAPKRARTTRTKK